MQLPHVTVTQPFSYPHNKLPAKAKHGETTAILEERPLITVYFFPYTHDAIKSDMHARCEGDSYSPSNFAQRLVDADN